MPGKIFHHDKMGAPLFFNGKDGDDVFVLEAGHCAGFTDEPLGKGGIAGKMFVDDLDCNEAIERPV
jgi:CRP-like cAMP-binding protein